MSLFKRKGFLITFILFLSTVLALVLSFALFKFGKAKDKEPVKAACVIDSNFTMEMYDNNSNFEIYSAEGFETMCFQIAFGKSDSEGWIYDNPFKNKTVNLMANITTGGHMWKFAGTFDGNGHSITVDRSAWGEASGSGGVGPLPIVNGGISLLCGTLNGTIKNLRMLNCSAFCESGGTKDTYAGIIVGENNGTIQNCIVENASFTSNRYQSNCNIGAIVGDNQGTIKDCLVTGSFNVKSHNKNTIGNSDGAWVYPFAASNSGTIKSCIFNVSYSESGEDTSMIKEDFSMSSYTYCYSSANQTSGLGASSVGGSTGSVWYYAAEYKSGWPMLRSFISGWTTIAFVSSDSNAGSVSTSTIQVPSNASSSYFDDANNSTSATIQVFSRSIIASAKDGYKFDIWSYKSSTKTYVANFKEKTYKISFKAADNVIENATSGFSFGTEYEITHKTKLYITCFRYENGKYKSIKFQFLDAKGNTYIVQYTEEDEYGHQTEYYIANCSLGKYETFEVVTDLKNITVTAALKTYNTTFD